jgi:cytochrome c-type biogenesis protein
MPEFNFAIVFGSFIAGFLTFFAPCTLPLVPAFLGTISGVSADSFSDPMKLKAARWRLVKNSIAYVIGFSIVFIAFGVAFSFLGGVISAKIWVERAGGIIVILFGMILLGWLRVPWLNSSRQIAVPQLFRNVSLLNSFLLGALFALGWSPCVGPLLGSILLLASTSGTVLEGTFLLAIFSLGLAIPFILTALLIGKALSAFGRWGNFISWLDKIAGVFLLFVGVLLAIGQFREFFGYLQSYLNRFQFFEVFINSFM